MAFHDDDAALGDMICFGVRRKVEADVTIVGHPEIFIDDGTTHVRVAADDAIVEDDGIFHHGACQHAHAASQYRVSHHTTGDDRAAGDDRIEDFPGASFIIVNQFGGRVEITGRAQRPLAVVQV